MAAGRNALSSVPCSTFHVSRSCAMVAEELKIRNLVCAPVDRGNRGKTLIFRSTACTVSGQAKMDELFSNPGQDRQSSGLSGKHPLTV